MRHACLHGVAVVYGDAIGVHCHACIIQAQLIDIGYTASCGKHIVKMLYMYGTICNAVSDLRPHSGCSDTENLRVKL